MAFIVIHRRYSKSQEKQLTRIADALEELTRVLDVPAQDTELKVSEVLTKKEAEDYRRKKKDLIDVDQEEEKIHGEPM